MATGRPVEPPDEIRLDTQRKLDGRYPSSSSTAFRSVSSVDERFEFECAFSLAGNPDRRFALKLKDSLISATRTSRIARRRHARRSYRPPIVLAMAKFTLTRCISPRPGPDKAVFFNGEY